MAIETIISMCGGLALFLYGMNFMGEQLKIFSVGRIQKLFTKMTDKTYKPVIFCYPVLTVMIYLLGGFLFKLWHPLWIIFLTIPIFYIVATRKKN